MQISSDGSVADDNLPNFNELQYLHRSSKPQVQCDRSNLTYPLGSDESSVGQTTSAVGSSDSRANSSGLHSSDGSPDVCLLNSFLAPAGVYVNLEAGLAYIAHFTTTEQHQGYLMNLIQEIICIGKKIEYVKEEIKKHNDQSGIPWDSITTDNTVNG